MEGSALKSPVCRMVCPSGRKKSSMAAPGQLVWGGDEVGGGWLDWDRMRRIHKRRSERRLTGWHLAG